MSTPQNRSTEYCTRSNSINLDPLLGGSRLCNSATDTINTVAGSEASRGLLISGGELCTCGVRGCIEAYCSATALIRDAVRAVEADSNCSLAAKVNGDLSLIDAKFVIDCAREGDPTAAALFDAYVDHLAAACVSIVHLLDPEVIANGGGVSHAGDFLFEPLRTKVLEKCFFSSHGAVVPAQLGNQAGIIGASMLE